MSTQTTFDAVPVGRYFVWVRSPELGALLKRDSIHAMDVDDREWRINVWEEVLLS